MSAAGRTLLLALVALLALAWGAPAVAQTYNVDSVTNVDLGQIAAGATGSTSFQVHPATGVLSKLSGAGSRISGGSGRVRVTVSCGWQGACNSQKPVVIIAPGASPTKRFTALTSFTVSTVGGTAVIATPPVTFGNLVIFTLQPIGRNRSKTFYLGYDLAVHGDNTNLPTGVSTAGLTVAITKANGQGTALSSGVVSATVFRTVNAWAGDNLSFGLVSRPRAGTGSVSLAPGQATLTVSGDGLVAVHPSTPRVATINVTGEGGQALSVSIPGTFAMTGSSGSITVTTIPSVSGAMTLSGSLGSAGSASVKVGGSFPLSATTPTGSYSGNFSVVFQYN